ncbi:MAG: RNA polymerase sigma factor [Sedimentisphaerales bacterium]|nr:RNA polymerase sigma factor [Sedimentisphaerales bacterium]
MSSKERKNESALVCAGRDGDKEALRELLEIHWPWLKGLVYNVLGSRSISDVDDVLQNICIIVIEKIHQVREPERFRPWLARLAQREAWAWRARQSRKPAQLDEIMAEQQSDDSQVDIAEQVGLREQTEKIIDAIGKLPEKYREVFLLKYARDITYAEIAEILDLPVTTVQIRLVRARRMIFNRLTGRPSDKVPRT